MDSVVILVLLIIVVAVVILLMKNIENSKKMDALRNDAIEKSKQKEAEYNTRKIPTVTDGYPSLSVQPRRQTLAIDVPPLEMIPVPDDIETVGDQSLALDEDPSQEYNEMAAVSGIREVAPPQTDENWVKSRQVEPVKDLSVGIAITNDVSKKENLQTGKISSKFPIIHKGPKMPTIDIPNAARQVAMQQAAQWVAQQRRDSEIMNVIDKRARSMAESAEMEKRARIDTSGIKQYDIPKGRKGPSLGLMKPAVMPNDYKRATAEAAEKAAMKDAKDAMMRATAEATEKAAMKDAKDAMMRATAEAAEKAAMKDAKDAMMRATAEATEKAAMKDAKDAMMRATAEAAEKAAMMSAVEGYEIMKPWGSMVY